MCRQAGKNLNRSETCLSAKQMKNKKKKISCNCCLLLVANSAAAAGCFLCTSSLAKKQKNRTQKKGLDSKLRYCAVNDMQKVIKLYSRRNMNTHDHETFFFCCK